MSSQRDGYALFLKNIGKVNEENMNIIDRCFLVICLEEESPEETNYNK